MADPAEPTRYAFEYSDEAGYLDGIGTLSQDQAVLIDEVIDDPHAPAFDFYVVNDEKTGIYEAITELIRRVLDDVHTQGKTVTIMCPIVRTFIEHNPEYADLIDPRHPGVTKGSHRP